MHIPVDGGNLDELSVSFFDPLDFVEVATLAFFFQVHIEVFVDFLAVADDGSSHHPCDDLSSLNRILLKPFFIILNVVVKLLDLAVQFVFGGHQQHVVHQSLLVGNVNVIGRIQALLLGKGWLQKDRHQLFISFAVGFYQMSNLSIGVVQAFQKFITH